MTPQQLADQLDGSEYPLRIGKMMIEYARQQGLVIVYGASDDLMEVVAGAIHDEGGCYDGGTLYIDKQGLLPDWEQIEDDEDEAEAYFKRKSIAKQIEAVWNKDSICWQYKTDIPHATFKIMEDGEVYCIGMVFDIKELS